MENLYNLTIYPEESIYSLSRKETDYSSFLVLIIANISMICAVGLVFGMSYGLLFFNMTWGLAVKLLIQVFCILLLTALYHYFAGVFGREGDGLKLFKVMPYSFLPYCFMTPVVLILKAFGGKSLWFLLLLVLGLLVIWMIRLQLKMLNNFYGLSGSVSVNVLAAPWIIMAGLFVSVVFVVITGIMVMLL